MKKNLLLALTLCLCLFPFRALAQPAKPKPASEAEKKKNMVVVKAPVTYLRSKPDKKLKGSTLTVFTPVEILEKQKDWAKVKTSAGKTGYVLASALADSRFVSTKISGGRLVNVRIGPEMNNRVKFTLETNYPLIVLEKKDKRVKVADWQGDFGWAHEAYLTAEKRFIFAKPLPISKGWINLRDGPGLDEKRDPLYPKRFMAQEGTIFEILEHKDNWLKVKHEDGDVGWCSANIVWGWHDPGVVKLKKE